jgi:hypothetical protein
MVTSSASTLSICVAMVWRSAWQDTLCAGFGLFDTRNLQNADVKSGTNYGADDSFSMAQPKKLMLLWEEGIPIME